LRRSVELATESRHSRILQHYVKGAIVLENSEIQESRSSCKIWKLLEVE
jgi:hypothetical protein